MRGAIAGALTDGRMTPRALVDRALVDFETAVARLGTVRPALLFAERDRIARELRAFADGRLARRLRAQNVRVRSLLLAPPLRRSISSYAIVAAPPIGVVFRRLPRDGSRLALLQRMRAAVVTKTRTPVDGILVYDFSGARTVLLNQSGAQRVHGYLRAS